MSYILVENSLSGVGSHTFRRLTITITSFCKRSAICSFYTFADLLFQVQARGRGPASSPSCRPARGAADCGGDRLLLDGQRQGRRPRPPLRQDVVQVRQGTYRQSIMCRFIFIPFVPYLRLESKCLTNESVNAPFTGGDNLRGQEGEPGAGDGARAVQAGAVDAAGAQRGEVHAAAIRLLRRRRQRPRDVLQRAQVIVID